MSDVLPTRYLFIKLILDQGIFESTQSNTKLIDGSPNGLTMEVMFSKSTGMLITNAMVTIFGMLNSDIKQLTKLQYFTGSYLPTNSIEIYAGYELNDDGMPPIVYKGQIFTAFVDRNNPSRPFKIMSQDMFALGNTNLPNIEAKDTHLVKDLIKEILTNYKTQTGIELLYQPINITNDLQINNFSTTGSLRNQLDQLTTQVGVQYKIDEPYLVVYNMNENPNTQELTISKYNGLLGYPMVEPLGISIRVRFNPMIRWGAKIKLLSFSNLTINDVELGNQEKDLGVEDPYVDTLETLKLTEWYINELVAVLQNRGKAWELRLKLNSYAYRG